MSLKIVASGIAPADLDAEIAVLLHRRVDQTLARLKEAERTALDRLEQFTPQERLLTLKEAAAYLHFSPRWLDEHTRGANPVCQFRLLGGEKRFRKQWLDQAIDNGSIKPRITTL